MLFGYVIGFKRDDDSSVGVVKANTKEEVIEILKKKYLYNESLTRVSVAPIRFNDGFYEIYYG